MVVNLIRAAEGKWSA